MKERYPGYLISFEGPEGSGKTLISPKLEEWINKDLHLVCKLLKEPGYTKIGLQIRAVLMNKDNKEMDSVAEAFLFQAARAQLRKEELEPRLKRGEIVALDRYVDSSRVYQGFARGLGMEKIQKMNEISTFGIIPDLTFLLDVDVEIGLKRKMQIFEWNRLDAEGINFHNKVRRGYYIAMAKDKSDRWVIVNTTHLNPDQVMKIVKSVTFARLLSSGRINRKKL